MTESVFAGWVRDICGVEPEDTRPMLERFRAELVAAARRDVGVRETHGPNDSPEIRGWLRDVGIGYPAAYCAAWTSAKIVQASIAVGLVRLIEPSNDLIGALPLEPSAGALRLAYHAEKEGAFVRRRIGVFPELEPGDLLFWKRPGASWTGHVGIVETAKNPSSLGFAYAGTIEANVPDQRGREGVVERTRDDLDTDPLFLGHLDWSRVRVLGGKTR